MMEFGFWGGVTGVTTSTVIGVSTFILMMGSGSGGGVPSTCVFTSRLEETGTGMLWETGPTVDSTGIGRITDPEDKTGIGGTVPNQCLAGDGFSSIFIATINGGRRFHSRLPLFRRRFEGRLSADSLYSVGGSISVFQVASVRFDGRLPLFRRRFEGRLSPFFRWLR